MLFRSEERNDGSGSVDKKEQGGMVTESAEEREQRLARELAEHHDQRVAAEAAGAEMGGEETAAAGAVRQKRAGMDAEVRSGSRRWTKSSGCWSLRRK